MLSIEKMLPIGQMSLIGKMLPIGQMLLIGRMLLILPAPAAVGAAHQMLPIEKMLPIGQMSLIGKMLPIGQMLLIGRMLLILPAPAAVGAAPHDKGALCPHLLCLPGLCDMLLALRQKMIKHKCKATCPIQYVTSICCRKLLLHNKAHLFLN
jgi:hypothetical protein